MLSEVPYFTFANYSPRGGNEPSIKSRNLCEKVKSGKRFTIASIFKYFDKNLQGKAQPFLNARTILVPVPRSSLLLKEGLWPSLEIAKEILVQGYGKEVVKLIERCKDIPKSSRIYRADERPSIEVHMNSLQINSQILDTSSSITLVDDVLTLGRTSYASAAKIHEVYPEIPIHIFTVFHTRGKKNEDPDITEVVNPETGRLIYNPVSGKVRKGTD